MKDIGVVVNAGGKGTRLYPYTKVLPKPLIPIGDLPIAEYIINSFYKYGATRFYMILNHKKNMIKAYFNDIDKAYEIEYVDEEKPLGTGGGISLLKGKISDTFIFTNCDILINDDFGKILQYHKESNNQVTMVCSLKNYKIPYGVVNLGEGGSIKSMEEKPTVSFFTNTGCYIVEPKVIDRMPSETEIGFPDFLQKYMSEGNQVGVYPIRESAWLDMGQLDAMEDMKKKLGISEQ